MSNDIDQNTKTTEKNWAAVFDDFMGPPTASVFRLYFLSFILWNKKVLLYLFFHDASMWDKLHNIYEFVPFYSSVQSYYLQSTFGFILMYGGPLLLAWILYGITHYPVCKKIEFSLYNSIFIKNISSKMIRAQYESELREKEIENLNLNQKKTDIESKIKNIEKNELKSRIVNKINNNPFLYDSLRTLQLAIRNNQGKFFRLKDGKMHDPFNGDKNGEEFAEPTITELKADGLINVNFIKSDNELMNSVQLKLYSYYHISLTKLGEEILQLMQNKTT